MSQNTDYTVTYENNNAVGTGTMTVQGIGKYTGTITRNFTIIDKYNIAQTSYIDESGQAQTISAAVLSGSSNTENESLNSGWYVVEGTVSRKSLSIESGQDVFLILKDGASLTLQEKTVSAGSITTKGGNLVLNSNSHLTIYGQSENSGRLTALVSNQNRGTSAIQIMDNSFLSINGGSISVSAPIDSKIQDAFMLFPSAVFTYNGKNEDITITGSFPSGGALKTELLTEDMIAVDTTNLRGSSEDLSEAVGRCVTLTNPTYAGKEFALTGWEQSVTKVDDTTYTVTYTHEQRGTVSKTVTLTPPCAHTKLTFQDKGDGTCGGTCPDCKQEVKEPHQWSEAGVCGNCQTQAAAKVEKDGTTTYVAADQFDAAFAEDSGNAGATFTLLGNIEREYLPFIEIDCTLNLDRYKISSESSGLSIREGSNVIIQGTGEIISKRGNALDLSGTATLEGGTFTSEDPSGCGIAIGNPWDAVLSVTGENVAIRNTNGGCGLYVSMAQSVQLSAGTYSGEKAAILVDSYGDDPFTLGKILAAPGADGTRYAYFNGTTPIAGKLGETKLTGTVTVGVCTHDYKYVHTDGSTTHSQTCPACGDAKVAEVCSYDAATGECACGSTLAVTLPADLNLTYNGAAQEPAVTVTLDGTRLDASKYEVLYAGNIDAGTNTAGVVYGDTVKLTASGGSGNGGVTWSVASGPATVDSSNGKVTVTGVGSIMVKSVKSGGQNYQNAEATVTFTAGKKTLTVAGATVTNRKYNGTTAVTIPAVALDGVVNGDDVSATATGAIDGSNAGTYTSVTLSNLKLKGGEAGNYVLANPEGVTVSNVSVVISKADALAAKAGDLPVVNKQAHTYTYGLGSLRPAAPIGQSYGAETVTYTLGAIRLDGYYTTGAKVEGQTLTLPIQEANRETAGDIGTITVTIHSQNYEDMSAIIQVRSVNKKLPSGAPVLSADSITYGQPLSTITLSGSMTYGGTVVPGAFAWSSPNIRPTVQESYSAAWTFTPDDNTTYAIVPGTAVIKVEKANQAALVIGGMRDNVVYGDTFALTVSGGDGDGIVIWSATGPTTVDGAGKVAVTGSGPVEITATKAGNTNFKEAAATVGFTAGPRALTVTGATAAGRAYDGTANVAVTAVEISGVLNGDDVSAAVTGLTGTVGSANVGTYTSVVLPALTLKGAKAACYTVPAGETATNVTISKAVPEVTAPSGLEITSGAALSTVALPAGWTWDNPSATVAEPGSFPATFTPSDTDNYEVVRQNLSVTLKAAVTPPTPPTPSHSHVWASAWSNDGIHHWHECTASGCGITADSNKSGYGAHVYDDDADAACNTCGYVRTVAPPAPGHTHSWAAAWSSNGSHHWHECTVKDCDITEDGDKDGYGVHTPGDWIIDVAPTATAKGSRHKACTVCGHTTTTESLPATGGGRPSGGGSSGGSSAPSIPSTPPVSTGTTTEGSVSITETTVKPSATLKGDTASSAVSSSVGSEIVKQAEQNKSDNVVIAPEIKGGVTRAEVSIPASTVGGIGSKTQASLTISTPVADVTIPNKALGGLPTESRRIEFAVERTGSAVELSVTAGGKMVESVPGGVKITVPAQKTTPGTVAMLVHEDGTREIIRKTVADNSSVSVPLDGSAKIEIMDNGKTFDDVPAESWASDAVAFASAHELFNGTSDTEFSPDLSMSRGMLAVVLHNPEGNPDAVLNGTFMDVSDSMWYADGVAWAAGKGIITGYGSGLLGPNDPITREQLAVMLWRYAGSPVATDKELHFTDVGKASGWALEALRWAVEKGIVNGKGGGILDPAGMPTRVETAQMLKNFLESM